MHPMYNASMAWANFHKIVFYGNVWMPSYSYWIIPGTITDDYGRGADVTNRSSPVTVEVRRAADYLYEETTKLDAPISMGACLVMAKHILASAAVEVPTLDMIGAKAREWAGHYPQSSDGRNTFVLFAEWVEGLPGATQASLPRRLTAENGAKAALIGEFHEEFHFMDEEGDECTTKVPVSWDTIKRIWAAAVEHFDRASLVTSTLRAPPGGQTMDDAAADNFGLTVDDLDEHEPDEPSTGQREGGK
jgi:hypothetical protein